MSSVNNGESMQAQGVGLSQLLFLTAVAGLVLAMLQGLTHVSSGYGIEDFLAWVNPDAIDRMKALWQHNFERIHLPGLQWTPHLYLTIDTAIFMPLYGLLLLAIGDDLRYRLTRRLVWSWAPVRWLVRQQFGALVGMLLLVDYVENAAGLARLDALSIFFIGVILQLFVARALLRPASRYLPGNSVDSRRAWLRDKQRELGSALCATALLGTMVLGGAFVLQRANVLSNPGCDAGSGLWLWGCYAHSFKTLLMGLLAVDFIALSGWLLYGPPAAQRKDLDVVAYRRALVSVVWRSRYVLLALAMVVLLLLVMDQGRDVIYAVAASTSNLDGEFALASLINSAIAVALSNIALWTFAFSSWLWTRCVVKTRSTSAAQCAVDNPDIEIFARDWARALGIAPCLIAVLMCVAAMGDAVAAAAASEHANWGPIVGLCAFVFVVLAGGIGFVLMRTRDDGESSPSSRGKYFDYATLEQTVGNPHYRLFGLISPTWLPIFALLAGLACRYLQLQSAAQGLGLPSLALAILLFELSFWLSLAGWLSLYEQRESVPWLLFVLILMGVLGAVGWTDNHVVTGQIGNTRIGIPLAGITMFAQTLKIAVVICAALALLLLTLRRATEAVLSVRLCGIVVLAIVAIGWIVRQADSAAMAPLDERPTAQEIQATHTAAARVQANDSGRVKLEQALAAWMTQVADGATPSSTGSDFVDIPVYFIAAEGGGIRSAYWTASVLAQLASRIPNFEERTFAISGVSGGSVGIAVYRACSIAAANSDEGGITPCVERFGRTDLLSPLVGAWFFEDVVARFLPQHCVAPGCGFLSRGLWFEAAMVTTIPELSHGLLASRNEMLKRGHAHVPYALLNSTWVETGERAIASEIAISAASFPTARAQLSYLGFDDLALVSAAHNSARFPFTNALGAVRNWRSHCAQEPPVEISGRAAASSTDKQVICGHLADGGYFDNSGGHAISDVLRAYAGCLSGTTAPCAGLHKHLEEKHLRLRPVVFLIRNGVKADRVVSATGSPSYPGDKHCSAVLQPDANDVAPRLREIRASELDRPRCAGNASLFVDLLGPLITALNTTGIGANGRLAGVLPGKIPLADGVEVRLLDLKQDGVLFPLGWHLSVAAQRGMKDQSERLSLKDFETPAL